MKLWNWLRNLLGLKVEEPFYEEFRQPEMYNMLRIVRPAKRPYMESSTQKDMHIQREADVKVKLSEDELDVLESALIEYGKLTNLRPELLHEREIVSMVLQKLRVVKSVGRSKSVSVEPM